MKYIITGCIVLYQNKRTILRRAINSFLNTELEVKLFLIDNSPGESLSDIISDERVTYIHSPSNPGFGASHNVAIDLAIQSGSLYHFIINPDIHFDDEVIAPMVSFMRNNKNVGMMMPEILNEDGSVQYLPKLIPSPFWIFRRKLKKPVKLYNQFVEKYELRNFSRDKIYNAPLLSGCFSLLNLDVIKEVGGYDDKFFMYFEDFDLSRRVHAKYKTIYFPAVSVYHGYESGANSDARLLKIFLKSAVYYFNKWGWVIDQERIAANKRALEQL